MAYKSLTRYAYLAIFTAIITTSLKSIAYLVTGSVGLLSDALESVVNFAAALMALFMLKLAEKPPDAEHMYGHTKAEYFSSVLEGILIIMAALSIALAAVNRFINPKPLQQLSIGLIICTFASLINFIVSRILIKTGRKERSITLEADGHHLMTDVWTSIAVISALILVKISGLVILDPIFGVIVAINIVITGFNLIKRSYMGFMDSSITKEEQKIIKNILAKYCQQEIQYHGLRTRQSATRRFVSVHILVPDSWSVKKGHRFIEKIEKEIVSSIPKVTVTTHLEPLNDSASWNDVGIDRKMVK